MVFYTIGIIRVLGGVFFLKNEKVQTVFLFKCFPMLAKCFTINVYKLFLPHGHSEFMNICITIVLYRRWT